MFVPIWVLLLISVLYFLAGWIGAWSRQEHKIRELRIALMSDAIETFSKTLVNEAKIAKQMRAVGEKADEQNKPTAH